MNIVPSVLTRSSESLTVFPVCVYSSISTDWPALPHTPLQVVNIRRLLTEILLTVTNDEITNIAQEAFDAAHKGRQMTRYCINLLSRSFPSSLANGMTVCHILISGSRHRLKPSGNASNLGSSGFLGT